MARVLDAPVTTHGTGESFHAYRQAADEIANLGRLLPITQPRFAISSSLAAGLSSATMLGEHPTLKIPKSASFVFMAMSFEGIVMRKAGPALTKSFLR